MASRHTFGDDAKRPFCSDEELREIKASRTFACALSGFDNFA